MIEDVEFVRDGNTGLFQVVDRSSDVGVLHVAARVVVSTDHKDTGMPAVHGLDQQVQFLEIIVVLGEQDQAVLHGVKQMAWIPSSR